MATISFRVDDDLQERMNAYDEINWSAVLRKTISEKLDDAERIDIRKARQASRSMDSLRNSNGFASGRSSVEIIREWRDRRK